MSCCEAFRYALGDSRIDTIMQLDKDVRAGQPWCTHWVQQGQLATLTITDDQRLIRRQTVESFDRALRADSDLVRDAIRRRHLRAELALPWRIRY